MKSGLISFLALACLFAQTPEMIGQPQPAQKESATPLQFEAASLKVAFNQDILENRPKRSIGRFRWNTALLNMLSYAYQMQPWRISDTPGLTTIYALEATAPPNATQNQVRLMLQKLLIERFHLKLHRTAKEITGYSLKVSKSGSKLQESKPSPETSSGAFDDGYVVGSLPEKDTLLLRGRNASMPQLAEVMDRSLQTTVLDQTNLPGRYDFEFVCTRDELKMSPGAWASCIKQAGLTVERFKGSVELLVIDQIGSLVEN